MGCRRTNPNTNINHRNYDGVPNYLLIHHRTGHRRRPSRAHLWWFLRLPTVETCVRTVGIQAKLTFTYVFCLLRAEQNAKCKQKKKVARGTR
ncbi:hypothetical protein F0562_030960 [Nyssa sinensis]|uniref:Uncharacterized protein n=1 Tax=Nyssa sinensis TaxID=561372 RepID=A0A5J5AUP3_9ASTE|nr:hypothetical protein F0562_030960 [Nyssa sinensis]